MPSKLDDDRRPADVRRMKSPLGTPLLRPEERLRFKEKEEAWTGLPGVPAFSGMPDEHGKRTPAPNRASPCSGLLTAEVVEQPLRGLKVLSMQGGTSLHENRPDIEGFFDATQGRQAFIAPTRGSNI
ncbi:hypothetical protein ACFV4I_09670 [Nocardiopsis alba]|uniref:hypothetical protein n=1 Tax=Nocardiopsis alba TaxID=53437 RepID=UPI00365D06EC